MAFTPENDRIISAAPETIQLLYADLGTGLSVETAGSRVAADFGPYGLIHTPTGPRIIVFEDHTMRWLDVDTGEQIGATVSSEALRDVEAIDFSRDTRLLAFLSTGNSLRVLDTSNGRPLGEPIDTRGETIAHMTLSPDGETLATSNDNGAVRLWDRRHGRPLGAPMSGHEYRVEEIEFSDDGRRLYTRSIDSVRVWDTATRQLLGTVDTPAVSTAMAISPDGSRLAVADYNYLQEFDATDAEPLGSDIPGLGHDSGDLACDGSGRYLVTIGQGVFITAEPAVSSDGSQSLVGGGIWELPAPAGWADELCEKLLTNPTREEMEKWVSADQSVDPELCPGKNETT